MPVYVPLYSAGYVAPYAPVPVAPTVPQQPQETPCSKELAELLTKMNEDSYEAWRHIIAFDLGMTELTDDLLDEEEIRSLLSDHGLPKPQNDIDSIDE